jgi:hypothetical protein
VDLPVKKLASKKKDFKKKILLVFKMGKGIVSAVPFCLLGNIRLEKQTLSVSDQRKLMTNKPKKGIIPINNKNN